MKFIKVFTIIALTIICLSLGAQDQGKIPEGISIALKAGNAAELSKYMNTTIELLLLDKPHAKPIPSGKVKFIINLGLPRWMLPDITCATF